MALPTATPVTSVSWGFYWLLRPAEYLHTTVEGRSQAFRLSDIHFTVDATTLIASDRL